MSRQELIQEIDRLQIKIDQTLKPATINRLAAKQRDLENALVCYGTAYSVR